MKVVGSTFCKSRRCKCSGVLGKRRFVPDFIADFIADFDSWDEDCQGVLVSQWL